MKETLLQVLLFLAFVAILIAPQSGPIGNMIDWIYIILFVVLVGMYIALKLTKYKRKKMPFLETPLSIGISSIGISTKTSARTYFVLTTLVFLAIGSLHVLRIVNGWEVIVSGWSVPMEFSYAAVVISIDFVWTGFCLLKKPSA